MEVYGSPWDHHHLSPSRFSLRDTTDSLRVIGGHAKLWIIGDAWPKEGLHLPELYSDNAHEVVGVRLVGTQEMLTWKQGDYGVGLSIQPPIQKPQDLPWVVEVDYIDTTP